MGLFGNIFKPFRGTPAADPVVSVAELNETLRLLVELMKTAEPFHRYGYHVCAKHIARQIAMRGHFMMVVDMPASEKGEG
jgi:hypothetical protein